MRAASLPTAVMHKVKVVQDAMLDALRDRKTRLTWNLHVNSDATMAGPAALKRKTDIFRKKSPLAGVPHMLFWIKATVAPNEFEVHDEFMGARVVFAISLDGEVMVNSQGLPFDLQKEITHWADFAVDAEKDRIHFKALLRKRQEYEARPEVQEQRRQWKEQFEAESKAREEARAKEEAEAAAKAKARADQEARQKAWAEEQEKYLERARAEAKAQAEAKAKAQAEAAAKAKAEAEARAQARATSVEGLDDRVQEVLRGLNVGPGGRLKSVSFEGGQHPSWEATPSNRQRLDHYVGSSDSRDEDDYDYDPEGWDEASWNEDYADPVYDAVMAALDQEFGRGKFYVEVSDKGFVTVQPNAELRKTYKFASPTRRVAARYLAKMAGLR